MGAGEGVELVLRPRGDGVVLTERKEELVGGESSSGVGIEEAPKRRVKSEGVGGKGSRDVRDDGLRVHSDEGGEERSLVLE